MKTLTKLTDRELAGLNELGGTDYAEAYALKDADAQEDYTSLTREKDGTWLFYTENRVEEFKNYHTARNFARTHGYSVEQPDANTILGARGTTPFDRTRSAVYATGNRWAIENFNATH